MTPKTITLIETTTGAVVAATLMPVMTAAEIVAAEARWSPHRRMAPDEAEHSHWDWSLKTGLLADPGMTCIGIECAGDMQGMAMIGETGHTARLAPDSDQPLVYVHFLESAPWNVRRFAPTPRYQPVGSWLLRAAVDRSLELGYGGRVGLHSLPQSEQFYERACRMTALGQDPGYNALMYYEFTAEGAAKFLPGGKP